MADEPKITGPQSQEDFEKRYPTGEFVKKEFNFSKAEVIRLQMYEGFRIKSQMEQQIDEQLLNQEISKALLRIGVKADPTMGIFYDTTEGKFWLYLSKKTPEEVIPKRSEVEKNGHKN